MAKPETKAPVAEGEAAPKKSKKVLIMLLALVTVLFIGGGAGAYFFLMKGDDEEVLDDEEVVVEKKKDTKKKKSEVELPPAFVEMTPFTVNLTPEDGEQYLQLILSVEAEDMPATDRIKIYTPKIRHEITLLLSGKKPSDIKTREGKEMLAEDMRAIMNKILAPGVKEKDAPVKAVLFTSFIIQ